MALSLMVGIFVNWIYRMLFYTVSLRRKCLCVSLLDLRILHTPVTYVVFIRLSTG
jgi:predicted Holliday junction resolvase-like endonuclease